MKKALIAILATTALTTVFAAPIVYDVAIKGKSTAARTGKITAACLAAGKGRSVTYRKQATINLKGLIWFCECESLAGPLGFTATSDDGCFFWDETNGKALKNGVIVWPVLHRIENKMRKAEGVMELTADGWHMMFAGFGKAESFTNNVGYLLSLKGNFAGYRSAPTWKWTEYGAPCTFCDSGTADIEYEETALAWPLCSCAEPTPYTAIFGTWNLKYNKALSARLNDATAITTVYTFPAYVKKEMEAPASK